jgi:Protein of unknown function (DUF1553)/Protein of unknown function (DUF1549)/Concanavalin A-like lectin/glucanases superfamily/Planctomycete cytochrome C
MISGQRTLALWSGLAAIFMIGGRPIRGAALPEKVDYNYHVKPLLSDRCYKCHGPDSSKRKANLRLDLEKSAKGALKDGKHPITPGDLAKSELYRRITSEDPDEKMPPPESKLKLAPDEIALLKRWIEQGAHWKKQWSFIPLTKVTIPKVQGSSWPRNAIDRFILARLEREGLKPSPEADRELLIRRLSFDLTGLPPTTAEIDAFLADTSRDAYENLVDRFLAKPEYGERMTVDWLDLARYSDSYGYQVDRDRFVWPWRDWVIKAFNENMPYDQFITWQLAGDLLPGATDEQILATTFNRLHSQKVEGGSTPEEFRVEYVVDRVRTFGTAFLGLTLQCMRCHDHKYDPLTQKEFYQFFAFFNKIDEAGLYSYFTPAVPTPTLLLEDNATKARVARVEKRVTDVESALAALKPKRSGAFDDWLKHRPSEPSLPNQLGAFPMEALEKGKFENTVNEKSPATSSDANQIVPGHVGNAIRLTGDDGVNLGFGNFRRYEPFSVALWMNTPDFKDRAVIYHRSKAWTDAGSRGYQLLLEDGKLSAALIHFWPGNAICVRTREPVPVQTWLHVAVTYDGSSRADGLKIYLNGRPAPCDVVRDHLYKNITGGGGDNITIGERMRDRGFKDGLIDEFQVFNRELTALEVAQIHDGNRLRELLVKPAGALTAAERDALFEYYLSTVDADYGKQLAALRDDRAERSKTVDDLEEIMVMRDLPPSQTRQTHLLKRGAYDAPGEVVYANTPASLPPFPAGEPTNRLGLARWLTDPGHPLTARVAVNRFWQMCFGQGLVRTPEDFGSQGELPTHPELLDWLAKDFLDHGWNVKRLMKQMVESATYRQSSAIRPEVLARDPQNRLLARAPRYRLSAEMLRDNALAASGLLVREKGGPPAKPYEVAVSFKPVKRDQGAGLYRRSLYTFWKQTGPAPVMMTLDATKRDVCVARRESTSTPLQALVLLDDPQFVEAARVLGQNMIEKHGTDVNAAVMDMFRVLTAREPSSRELKLLNGFYREQLEHFRDHPEAAREYLKTGDAPCDGQIAPAQLAASGVLASTLMNLDDCVRKR